MALTGMILVIGFFFITINGCESSDTVIPNTTTADTGGTAEEMANQQCQNATPIYFKMSNPEITAEEFEAFAAQFSGNTAHDDFLTAAQETFGDDFDVLTPGEVSEIGEETFQKIKTSWGRLKGMFNN